MRPTLFPRAFSCTLTAVLLFGLGAQAASPLKFGEALPANMFVELARVVNPAVVNISTKILPKFRGSPYGDRRNDPLFDMMQQLYGMQMVPQQPREQKKSYQPWHWARLRTSRLGNGWPHLVILSAMVIR